MRNEHVVAVEPDDRDELLELIADQLRQKYETQPEIDDDGDFMLEHDGLPVWVSARRDQPVIEMFACVVMAAASRRAAAIETSLLNRENLWSRWIVRDSSVWQVLRLPASPFVPAHLETMLEAFFDALSATRDDLLLRLGQDAAA